MDLIKQYIIALTNLYGQVPADIVVDVYNGQNKDQLNIEDLEVYFYEDLSRQHVYAYKDHFVHETIMEFDEFKLMQRKKADKPYYVPPKEELLKYLDTAYYDLPKQYLTLEKYMTKSFFSKEPEIAEMLCQNIRWECVEGSDMQLIFDLFNLFEVNFKDEKQVNEVLGLVMDLSNNVRLWENNGHTPHEIFEKFDKPNMKPLPAKPFEFNVSAVKKIGRNDLCPCGSGKKYKKCCLGKKL